MNKRPKSPPAEETVTDGMRHLPGGSSAAVDSSIDSGLKALELARPG